MARNIRGGGNSPSSGNGDVDGGSFQDFDGGSGGPGFDFGANGGDASQDIGIAEPDRGNGSGGCGGAGNQPGEAGDIRPSQRSGSEPGGTAPKRSKGKKAAASHSITKSVKNVSRLVFKALGRAIGASEAQIAEMQFRDDELFEVAEAWAEFSAIWFPDAEETILPPKWTSAFALIAAFYALGQPRVALLAAIKSGAAPEHEPAPVTKSAPYQQPAQQQFADYAASQQPALDPFA